MADKHKILKGFKLPQNFSKAMDGHYRNYSKIQVMEEVIAEIDSLKHCEKWIPLK